MIALVADPCTHCKRGEHEQCWGVGCTCLVCIAEDKDEFSIKDAL